MRAVAARFSIHGELVDARRYGSGHINDTQLVIFDQAGAPVRYIFQRINHRIFKKVPALMENISRVTSHILKHHAGGDNRRVLTLVPALDGKPYCHLHDGDYWRVYLFIEAAHTYDTVETPAQAFEAARAFGRFQQQLADLPGGRLHESIPHFHDTPRRFEALRRAADKDARGRRAEVAAELDFAFARGAETARLLSLACTGAIPERITHNDTKLNNVMLDDTTGEGICVLDLDTVMPGLSLYDFGDLVRFACNTAVEDETDARKINVSLPVFDAVVRGYLAGAGNILTPAEWEHLVFAGKLMTYEVGIRFLTDYLEGDVYFKIAHPKHNLERARNQLRLVERIETADAAMQAIVKDAARCLAG